MSNHILNSADEKKLLYKACRRVLAETGNKWPSLYESIGDHSIHGIDYESNFRAGRIQLQRARSIYRWLAKNHPAHASWVYSEILRLHIAKIQRMRSPGSPKAKRLRSLTKKTLRQLDENHKRKNAEIALRKRQPPHD